MSLVVREYGPTTAPKVVVLHGGPGAAGDLAPLATLLATDFRIFEPLQRGAASSRLTVARHIADLLDVLDRVAPGECPHLVGHSWGAMLALAFAAAHPQRASALTLVGCGTFDAASRAQLRATIESRTTDAMRAALTAIEAVPDASERMSRWRAIMQPVYDVNCDVAPAPVSFDARAHRETWDDMLGRQADGTYPASFAAIDGPVLMLHGREDPHPGRMIHASLAAVMPRVEYRELATCGHDPWRERHARAAFLSVLRSWIVAHG